MRRLGAILKLKPGTFEQYKAAHAAVWPEVLTAISMSNIRNYSIYHKEGWLFSYCEYHGQNYESDMARMAQDPSTQEWWKLVGSLQDPLTSRLPGEWWSSMEEVFHLD
jgi:L-rhamnose mutarotase